MTTPLSANLILLYSLYQGFSRSRHFDILDWKILCPVYYRMFISIPCLYTVDARSAFSAVMTIKNVPRYYQTSGARREKLSHLKTTDLDVSFLLSWKKWLVENKWINIKHKTLLTTFSTFEISPEVRVLVNLRTWGWSWFLAKVRGNCLRTNSIWRSNEGKDKVY